jgi:acyl carrier protein
MAQSAIHDEVIEIVRQHAAVAAGNPVAIHTRLIDDLGIDSFSLVCIAFAVRERFGLSADPDLAAVATVGDLVAYAANNQRGDQALPAA